MEEFGEPAGKAVEVRVILSKVSKTASAPAGSTVCDILSEG